jgi:predicted helicase
MGKPPGRPKKKDITKDTLNKTQDKRITKEKTNRQKGQELEVRAYNELRKFGIVTVRTSDGHFDQDIEKYVGTGDGGVDMISVTEEGITLYVQCKNWESSIGVETLRSFSGALQKYNTRNEDLIGIIIGKTFTEHATMEAKCIKGPPIILTTLQDVGKTLLEILVNIQTDKKLDIKIKKAEYVSIERKGTKVIAIGTDLNTEIRNA